MLRVPQLIALLGHDEARVRYRVRIELSSRQSGEVVATARRRAAQLVAAPAGTGREHELLELLWAQQQQQVIDELLLERLLASPDARARAAAVRVLRHLRRQVEDPLPLLATAIRDEHPRVRLEALVALSFFPEPRAAELALRVLDAPRDRFLDEALDETLRALEPTWRAALADGTRFAAEHPAGLAWALAQLDDEELDGVAPSDALDRERLSRPGRATAEYARAARSLSARTDGRPGEQLLAAIEAADAREDGHADHLLVGLFAPHGAGRRSLAW